MTIRKELQVTLRFSVDIDESLLAPERYGKKERPYRARQLRLLKAILSNPEHLDAYLRYQIETWFECMDWRNWQGLFANTGIKIDAQEILAPVLATLDASDQQYFQECSEEDVFFEAIEKMDNCFSAKLEKTTMSYVEGEEAL